MVYTLFEMTGLGVEGCYEAYNNNSPLTRYSIYLTQIARTVLISKLCDQISCLMRGYSRLMEETELMRLESAYISINLYVIL